MGKLLSSPGVRIVIVIIVVLVICICLNRYMQSPLRKRKPIGGDYTSITSVSERVNAAYENRDNYNNNEYALLVHEAVSNGYDNIKDEKNKIVYHSIAEAVLVSKDKGHKLSNINAGASSSGAFNTVFLCKYDGQDAVIRIRVKMSGVGPTKHKYENDCTARAIALLKDSNAIAVPFVSSVSETHTYTRDGQTVLMVIWSVLPFLRPYNNQNDLKNYIRTAINTLPTIHRNNLYYFDWKHDNVMVDAAEHVLISDIEFHGLAQLTSGVDKGAKSHRSSSRMDEFFKKMKEYNKKEWIDRYDNQMLIRDILISTYLLYNEEEEPNYIGMITGYTNYEEEEEDAIDKEKKSIVSLGKETTIPDKLKRFFIKDNLDYLNLTDDVTVAILQNILNVLDGKEADIPIDYEDARARAEADIKEVEEIEERERREAAEEFERIDTKGLYEIQRDSHGNPIGFNMKEPTGKFHITLPL